MVEDPDYIKQEVAEYRRKPLNFDFIGLAVLSLVMSCWEIMLSKGQEWDWLGDPFWRVQTLLVLFVAGLGFLIYHELRTDSPIINFRCLKDRNLSLSCVIMFFAFAVVCRSCIALPSLLQGLFGYDALRSGMMMSPAGTNTATQRTTVWGIHYRGFALSCGGIEQFAGTTRYIREALWDQWPHPACGHGSGPRGNRSLYRANH